MEFYRYVLVQYASIHDDGEYGSQRILNPNPSLILHTYSLHKETPKGYWIGYGHPFNGYQGEYSRWVSKTARKRYAYPTKEEALHNFIKRTESRIKYFQNDLDKCRVGLGLAKKKRI